MEFRMNPTTGKKEIKIEPEGLPPIWVSYDIENLCDRCKPFKSCQGFDSISTDHWNQLNSFVEDINNDTVHKNNDLVKVNLKKSNKCKISYG